MDTEMNGRNAGGLSEEEQYRIQIGKQLKKYRKAKSLSQAELAQYLFCSMRHLSQVECGYVNLTEWEVIKTCERLRISANDLFGTKDVVHGEGLDRQEREILSRYRSATENQREQIRRMLSVILMKS